MVDWKNTFTLPHIIGYTIGVIAIITGLIFYLKSIEKPDLTFYIAPYRSTIVESGVVTDLQIIYRDKKLKGNVSIAKIAIVNEGRKPIKKNSILKEIIIKTKPRVKILNAKVTKSTREVINFRIDVSKLKNGLIPVSWKILEENDGAEIEIIYEGPYDIDFDINGIIIGQKSIDIEKQKILKKSPKDVINFSEEDYILSDQFRTLSIISLFISISLFTMKIMEYFDKKRKDMKKKTSIVFTIIKNVIIILSAIALSIISIYFLFFKKPTYPF